MTMLPPPHHPDEHLMHARTQRKLQDAKGSRGSRRVSTGDVVLLSLLALAATAVIALAVLVLF